MRPFGHVPVPYSGDIVPDGHMPDHVGAWPCDGFYGDMDGTWTDNAVNDLAPPGQDDDPDTRFLTQRAGQSESVLTGQHQIQNDEIDRGLRHHPTHLGAVLSGRNPVTLAGQVLLHEIADFTLIVDD